MRVELYAGNLHHGGAVVVAATFLDQLPLLWGTEATAWIDELSVVASQRVASDMMRLEELRGLNCVELTISDDRPRVFVPRVHRHRADVRFTVFGPAYQGRQARVEVVGFADGSIVPAQNESRPDAAGAPGAIGQLAGALKRRRKLQLLRQADGYIVQTDQMAAALGPLVSGGRVDVLPNIVPAAFHDRTSWVDTDLPERLPGEVRFFYPARGYPHKNHAFIPLVCAAFKDIFGVPLRVVVTLRPEEFRALGPLANDPLINVGEISVAQCPPIFEQTDGLLFPSLNETASSSPLEALFMGKPVVAVDLPFMRVMTHGFAGYYFDGDAEAAARAIHAVGEREGAIQALTSRGSNWVRQLPTPKEQASAYLSILRASRRA